mgnify:CR=1 FL=1|jgi:hypothetical protein
MQEIKYFHYNNKLLLSNNDLYRDRYSIEKLFSSYKIKLSILFILFFRCKTSLDNNDKNRMQQIS